MAEGDQKNFQRTAPTVEESYSLLFGITKRLEDSLDINNKGLKALRFPMFSMVKALHGFAGDAINMQKQSLAFNQNFNDVMKAQGGKMEKLPGGLKTSMESALSFQKAGIFDVSKETLNLANTMKITGQDLGAFVGLNKKLITAGTLSRTQMKGLNQGLTDNSLRFGVSTDLLVGAMGKLGEGLTVLGFTGGAGKTLQGVQDLAAKFPALGDTIGTFADQLATGAFGDLAKLGIVEDVDKLLGQGLSGDELVKVIERINKRVEGFGRGAQGVAGQRARMDFAGPLGIISKQIGDGMKNFKPNEEQKAQSKIFQDFTTAMKTLLFPVAAEVGKVAIGIANFVIGIAKTLDGFVSLGTIMKALTSAIIAQTIVTKLAAAKEAGTSLASMLLLPLKVISLKFILIAGAVFGLITLIGHLSGSIDTLAEAEKDKAKVELAQLRSDDTPTRFESLTRILINTQLRQFETLNAARTNDMSNFTGEVVAAVDRNTDAVDDTVARPTFRST